MERDDVPCKGSFCFPCADTLRRRESFSRASTDCRIIVAVECLTGPVRPAAPPRFDPLLPAIGVGNFTRSTQLFEATGKDPRPRPKVVGTKDFSWNHVRPDGVIEALQLIGDCVKASISDAIAVLKSCPTRARFSDNS